MWPYGEPLFRSLGLETNASMLAQKCLQVWFAMRVEQLEQVDSILSLLSLALTCIVMDESAKNALE